METYPVPFPDFGFHAFIEDYRNQFSEPILLGNYTCPIWLHNRHNTLGGGTGEMFTSLDVHLATEHLKTIWHSNFDLIIDYYNDRPVPRPVRISYRYDEIE